MSLDPYWQQYDATLARIREERPATTNELAEILVRFSAPSRNWGSRKIAFFPGGADDTLADALMDAGWRVRFIEGDYLWQAKTATGVTIHYVEGDIYEGEYRQ